MAKAGPGEDFQPD